MNTKMKRNPTACRDCLRPTEIKAKTPSGAVCWDCSTKYLRTKPIFGVEEILRLAREFVAAEIRCP